MSKQMQDLIIIGGVVLLLIGVQLFGQWVHQQPRRLPTVTCLVSYNGPGSFQTQTLPAARACVIVVRSDRRLLMKARLRVKERGEEKAFWLSFWRKKSRVDNAVPWQHYDVQVPDGQSEWRTEFFEGRGKGYEEIKPLRLSVYLFPIIEPYDLSDPAQVTTHTFDFAPPKS